MENYFRDYSLVKNLLIKRNRGVLVAQSNQNNPEFPKEFVVKYYSGIRPPKEFHYHDLLFKMFPNMLKLYCSWNDGQKFYMAIEYCPGGDLHQYLEKLNGESISLQNSLIFCYQLVETVRDMHKINIVHRDIKPLNVFINSDFSWFKLGDFGETKEVQENSGFNTLTGTPFYMSPEQMNVFEKQEENSMNPFRNDIWALGKTFLEIFMGKLCPETFRKDIKSLHQYIDENFEAKNLDPELGSLIKAMMEEHANFTMTAERVLQEINRLYYKHFPIIQEELSKPNPVEEIKDENRVVASIYVETSIVTTSKGAEINKMIQKQVLDIDKQANKLKETYSSDDSFSEEKKESQSVKLEKTQKFLNFRDIRSHYPDTHNEILIEPSIENSMPPFDNISVFNNHKFHEDRPAESSKNSVPEPKVALECCICNKDTDNLLCVLPCGHPYHNTCLREMLKPELSKSSSLAIDLKCIKCGEPISYEFLEKIQLWEPSEKKIITLQKLRKFKISCPICSADINSQLLNKKLKPKSKKCKSCKTVFCSFCAVKGSHFFYCSAFRNFYKGRL